MYTDDDVIVFKKFIMTRAKTMLCRTYGCTRKRADDLIAESCLEKAIERNPTLFVHMSPEQVLDCVLY